MAYEIRYTDSVNKGSIIVEDGTLNTETSLTFPGRNVTSYGQAVSENFLHLLENFASETAPERPVEGQLWYDVSEGNDQLKIYDGTNWVAAGGLKKANSEPAVANSTAGELWVNTESQQLYLFTGTSWVLVGPEFSDGLLTGTQSESIVGTDDVSYNVLTIKIEEQNAVIISDSEFSPKTAIPGFRSGIKPGLNISAEALVGTSVLKYWGTSEKAEALVVAGETIPASNFLRGNASSSTDFDFRVKNNEGVKIGSGGQLNIAIDGEAGVIQHNTSGSNIDFRLRDGTTTPTILRIDASGQVGINNPAPEEALDVLGNIKVSPKSGEPLTGTIQVENVTNSQNISTGSVVTKGGIAVAKNAYIGQTLNVAGTIETTNIQPDQNITRNIGTTNLRYDQIYAQTFFGNLQGNVSGTVSGRAGSADRLASATTFGVSGDVENTSFEFDGQIGGTSKTFDIRIANSFISAKDPIYDIDNADELLINKIVGETGVYRVTKRNFLKSIPLVPAGVFVPFGGEEPPEGWLFCDGQEVNKSDYTILWEVIGHNFRDPSLLSDLGVNKFALPDMRGRFPLGLDNLGGPSANRVTDIAADAIGGNAGTENKNIDVTNLPEHEHDLEGESGTQYYGIRQGAGEPVDDDAVTLQIEPGLGGTQGLASSGGVKTNSDLGDALNVMNPYLAVNYIIYTGT